MKTTIISFLSALALVSKSLFDFEIPGEFVDAVANLILAAITLYGIGNKTVWNKK